MQNPLKSLSHPAVDFLVAFVRGRIERARDEDLSRGASAVEWVIISAVVVAIVGVVAGIIYNALQTSATKTGNCITNTSQSGTC